MDLVTIQQQLETLLNQTDEILRQYHEAKTTFENLDKQEKPMLAQIACAFEGSEASKNNRALADSKYNSFKMAVRLARKEYNRCWALLEGLRLKTDILRSLNKNLQ